MCVRVCVYARARARLRVRKCVFMCVCGRALFVRVRLLESRFWLSLQ